MKNGGTSDLAGQDEMTMTESETQARADMRFEILKYRLQRQNAAQSYNGEMSKWILGSLIVVNGSPFLLLTKDLPDYAKVLSANAWYFTWALSFAIVCGFFAWLNTGMREAVSGFRIERIIADLSPGDESASDARGNVISVWMVKIAYSGAVITGLTSLAMFLVGTFNISLHYCGERNSCGSAVAKKH